MVQTKSAGGPGKKDVRFSDNRKARAFDPDIGRYLVAWDQVRPSKWSATFLPTTGICLISLGITLVVLGGVRNQADLIVLGVIFIVGSLIFFTLMYTAVCRPFCHRNQVDTFTHVDEDEPEGSTSRPLSEPPPYSYHEFSNDDFTRAKSKPVPRDSVLYAEKARQFVATPATTTDIHFAEGGETPPPPRIALPHGLANDNYSFEDDYGIIERDDFAESIAAPPPAVYDAGVKTKAEVEKEFNDEKR